MMQQLPELPPLALYVHFPWCLKKCPYCDFNSHPQRAGIDNAALHARYVQALLADIESCLPLVQGRHIVSVFLGGGTPSLFAPELIADFLRRARALLPFAPDCEITLEANPGTFERERFAAYRAAGVTRLSIGVQSFNDRLLAAIGRVHNGAQARAAAEEAARHFEQFNLDLMYALPGQNVQEWREDLNIALSFAPPHLSTYQLTLEEGTPFAKKPPPLPDDDIASAMMDASDAACTAAGLQRYEVSAWARAACQCTHNLNYWQFGDYLGIGAGAHAKISFAHRIIRHERARQPEKYMQAVFSGKPIENERQVESR
ncbi:MAG: radical SAM family heme chaperone HemW, partial [Ottowia sp.]|nr:radical SAM family heme chaperone HemW [Ottowia sp.]